MKATRYVFGMFALCACVAAHAAGSGEFTRKGQSTKLPNAFALRQPDHFDKNKILTTVLFSSKPLDAAKVNAAAKPIDEAESQMREAEASWAEIDIAADGSIESIGFHAPGVSVSGGTSEKPVLVKNDEKRIEGSFKTKDESEKAGAFGGYYDLKFALDIAPSH